ncbi:MAG: RNA 3'-terminal phosphate cyclase [Desulfobacterales bacterium]|nr:RNA 3'-terminal phosphate cyclase [Desulfobacterales bacterium]
MITIDGSFGEGGGQIPRSSLALSLVTGKPFQIINIRASRKRPGLMRQHLTALKAAAEIGSARVTGAELHSTSFSFDPGEVRPGEYHFDIGTAGSCTLVLQTVLPALLTANGDSRIILEGGTHNEFAPPFDFLVKTFLPIVNRMGPGVEASLERPGFYPAGGGRFSVTIHPVERLRRVDILERGKIRRRLATAVVARLPRHIAERELNVVRKKLAWDPDCLRVEEVENSRGPGNVLTIEVESEAVTEAVTEVFTGFGKRGVTAEKVGARTVKSVTEYLNHDVPVGRHLADQILIPMALARGGRFRTLAPTSHTRTNAEVLKRFLDIDISMEEIEPGVWEVGLEP